MIATKSIVLLTGLFLIAAVTTTLIQVFASESEYACELTNVFSDDHSAELDKAIEDSLFAEKPTIDFRKIDAKWISVCLTTRNYAGNYNSYTYAEGLTSHYNIVDELNIPNVNYGKESCWGWSNKYFTALFISKNGITPKKIYIPRNLKFTLVTEYIKNSVDTSASVDTSTLAQCATKNEAVASCLWLERVRGTKECLLYFRKSRPEIRGLR